MPLPQEYLRKLGKFILVFDVQAFDRKKSSFRAFSPAAGGSGGEQLTPISNMKFERSLTQPSMVKL
jgi:hypothetical protein